MSVNQLTVWSLKCLKCFYLIPHVFKFVRFRHIISAFLQYYLSKAEALGKWLTIPHPTLMAHIFTANAFVHPYEQVSMFVEFGADPYKNTFCVLRRFSILLLISQGMTHGFFKLWVSIKGNWALVAIRYTECNSSYFTSVTDLNNSANTGVDYLHKQNLSANA